MIKTGERSLGRTIGLGLAGGLAAATLSGDVAPNQPTPMETGALLAAPYAACVVTSVVDLQRRTESTTTDTSGRRTTIRVGLALHVGPQALQGYAKYKNDDTVMWDPAHLNGLVNRTGNDGKQHYIRVSSSDRAGYFRAEAGTTEETLLPRNDYPMGTHLAFFVNNRTRVFEGDTMTTIDGATPCDGGAVLGVDQVGQPEWQYDPAQQFPTTEVGNLHPYIP